MKKLLWIQKTIVIVLLASIMMIAKQAGISYLALSEKEKGYEFAKRDVESFMDASRYLTEQARLYAETENVTYLYNYFKEIDDVKRRETALSNLENGAGEEVPEIRYLKKAYSLSNNLAEVEYHAMRLVANANYLSPAQLPESLSTYSLSDEEKQYDHKQALSQARYLLFNATYLNHQEQIQKKTAACCQLILTSSEALKSEGKSNLSYSITQLYFLVILLSITELAGSVLRFHYNKGTSKKNTTTGNKKPKRNKGFTHFDLILTVGIVLFLICILAPTFFKYLNRSRDTKAEKNATEFRKLVEYVLVDSLMNDGATADFTCYQNYQAFSTRYLPPNELSSISAQKLYEKLDFGKDQYDVVALYNDSTVTQLVYKDLKHQVIYVWYSESPQGTIFTKEEYSNQPNNWMRFSTSTNETWEPTYTGFEKEQVCWNGFPDPNQFLLKQ